MATRELRVGAHARDAAAVERAARRSPDSSDLDCANTDQQRILTNLMIESLDTEIGRLLVDTGLASAARTAS